MHFTATTSLALLPLALAKTIDVAVGQNGLMFTPNIVTAAVGDKVDFHFFPKNHSVVQSSFDNPCVPIQPDGGIFSGFQPTNAESKNVFEVVVNNTNPVWIFCAQAKHCQSGMSMVINQPSNNKTLAAYQQAAKSVPASVSPPSVNGGRFITVTNTTSSSGNGTASASGTGSAFGASSTGGSSSSSTSGGSRSSSGSFSSSSGVASSSNAPISFPGAASANAANVAAMIALVAAGLATTVVC